MAHAKFSVSAQGYAQYRELAKKLRAAGRGDLRKKLRARMTEAGKPIVDDVRAAVQAIPITSTRGGGSAQRRKFNVVRATTERAKRSAFKRHSGLRRSIASATKLQITAKGVRFVVNSNALPEKQQSLPRHLDSAKGWRHPVFGDRHNWVHQQGRPYFASTIKRKAPAFRQAIIKAMDDIRAELEK